jgi:hypothetical protein
MKTEAKTSAIQVDARDERNVMFTPRDEDRFFMSCERTIKAVQHGAGALAIRDEIEGLMKFLASELTKEAGKINSCFASPRDGRLMICVVPKGQKIDFVLGDRLAALDLEIAEKFQALTCDVLQIPEDTIDQFVNMETAWPIYGQTASRTPQK